MRTSPSVAGAVLAALCSLASPAASPGFEASEAAFAAGDYAAAAEGFERLLETTPDWADGWMRLGQCRFLLGNPGEAESAMQRAAAVGAGTALASAYRVAGTLLYRANRYEEAIAPLERAVVLGGDDDTKAGDTRLLLGYAQYLGGRYAAARRTLESHLSAGGFAADPSWFLALTCQKLGDYACALDRLESIVDDGGTRRGRALRYLALWSRYHAEHGAGDRELLQAAALRHASAWYRAQPADEEALDVYAFAMLQAGRAEQLVAELADGASADGCRVSLQLARALNALERREAAEEAGRRALDCDPMSADAAIEIAYARAARLRPEHTLLLAVLEDRALARSALDAIAEARRIDPARATREERLERQLLETVARLEEAAEAFEAQAQDYRRQLEEDERDATRQRCLTLLWILRTESRALSDEERRFYEAHDCKHRAP